MFLPKEVAIKQGQPKLKLAAILGQQFGLDSAEVVAQVKHHKKKVTYSKQFLQFMKENQFTKDDFKPLEDSLLKQVKKAEKKPELFLEMLQAYLTSGQAPDFTVTIEP